MNTKKYIVALAVFLTLGLTNSAFAADATIFNTGDGLKYDQRASSTNDVSVNNSNTSNTEQTARANINTGGNTYDRNINLGGGSGGIQSGDAYFAADFVAPGNSNFTSVNAANPEIFGLPSTYLVNTGDNTRLNNRYDNSNSVSVTNDNYSSVDQSAYFNATTGNNKASRNIGYGTPIVSGDASFNAGFYAGQGNQNTTSVSTGGYDTNPWMMPGGMFQVYNTGDGFRSSSDYSQSSRVDVNNYNYNRTQQSSYMKANTGNNKDNRGYGSDSVRSGSVSGSTYFDAGQGGNNWTFLDNGQMMSHLMDMWHHMMM